MLNLLIINVVLVFIIDVSGFIGEVSEAIWSWIHPNVQYTGWLIPKPFSCSLCATFWAGVLYCICTTFTWPMLGYICLLAYSTAIEAELLLGFKELILRILRKIK